MLFPDINTLFTVDLNRYFGTHGGTDGTTVALFCIINTHRPVSLRVIFFRLGDMTFGTKMNAEEALLA
jgi:hypothetical protein